MADTQQQNVDWNQVLDLAPFLKVLRQADGFDPQANAIIFLNRLEKVFDLDHDQCLRGIVRISREFGRTIFVFKTAQTSLKKRL